MNEHVNPKSTNDYFQKSRMLLCLTREKVNVKRCGVVV